MQSFEPPSPATAPGNVMDWSHFPVRRRDAVAIPTVWLTLILSLLTHFAMLWYFLPQISHPTGNGPDPGKAGSTLVAQLKPMPPPAASPPPAPAPVVVAPPIRPAPSAPPPRRPPTPREPPAAFRPRPLLTPVPQPAAPKLPPPPAETDLASYVAARRQERGEPQMRPDAAPAKSASEIESERRDRVIASNLASGQQQPTFGYDPRTGGGIFQLKRMSDADAEFWFTGWDKDIGRRAKQLIEVRRGTNSDIRLAIVRRIISIIRDEVKEDFTWKSEPSGRVTNLSARPGDNDQLEAFLLHEFFPEYGGAR